MERKHFRGHCRNGCGNQLFLNDMMAKYCSPTCDDAQYKTFRGLCLNGCGQIVALSRQKYCSLKCQHAYQFRILSAALEAGKYRAYNCNGFIRKYLISKIGEQCSSCGWHERHPRTGRVPVEVEHIDGIGHLSRSQSWARTRASTRRPEEPLTEQTFDAREQVQTRTPTRARSRTTGRNSTITATVADVAQLVESRFCKAVVAGSNPAVG